MALPQLIEEDLRLFDSALAALISKSEASMAILIDQAGFLITQAGQASQCDTTTLAALAAGSFAATQGMASLTRETNFNSVYQQGDKSSLLILSVDENCLLVVVFDAAISVGAVKYYALTTVTAVAEQLKKAHERNPDVGIDLAALNLEDTSTFFQRKKVDVN
ncbi:MAG: roadblock/LC7 domain-containing protein [Verrucomicrobia bacterium]|nr:roadblock/LC7 domain-containing protein [Verrucomicrobiota bacterium]